MTAAPIAVDAFGGDHCPRAEVEGAILAAREGHSILLVGDQPVLEALLGRLGATSALPLRIHHAPDVIAMDDSPAKAVRQKPSASMPVCFDLVKQGQASSVVSSGNSGAMLACGLFKFGRIKGVERPAICTRLPNENGFFQLLDAGANVQCRPLHLAQFAVMGAVYHSLVSGTARPRVGVLSNGTEESKGTDLTRAVDRVLRQLPAEAFEYVGYVEGGIFRGACDVAIADGFTGNVALKIAEAAGALLVTILRQEVSKSLRVKLGGLLMKPAFQRARRESHPDHYGGAPLLGVKELAIICHGSSSPRTLATAVGQAADLVRKSLGPALGRAITAAEPLFEAARAEEAQETPA